MGKRYLFKKLVIAALLLPALALPAALSAQIHDSLVILPFTGTRPVDADEIAYSLSEQDMLWNIFADVSYIEEQGGSVMMDTAYVIDYGYREGASHVISGHTATIDGRNIILISLLDVGAQQLISGYYAQYSNWGDVNVFEIASQFAFAASVDTSYLPPLFVPAPVVRSGSQEEAAILAQALSIELARRGVYAIYPVDYDPEYDENPVYEGVSGFALMNTVRRDGLTRTFTADIYDMTGVDHIDWAEESYTSFSQALGRMPRMAAALTDGTFDMQRGSDDFWENLFYANGTKFWSVGVNLGTSFRTPIGIANVTITATPLQYMFLEAGLEFGTWLTAADERKAADYTDRNGYKPGTPKYYSMYYFFRANGYYPVRDWIGVYLGLGVGGMGHRYIYSTETLKGGDYRYAVYELSTGVFIGANHNFFRLNYSMRTKSGFDSLGHRLTIGHTYRFY